MRVLLSDGSGLTARQAATQLASGGHAVHVLSPDPICLARWTRRVHRVPAYGAGPLPWLAAALRVYRCTAGAVGGTTGPAGGTNDPGGVFHRAARCLVSYLAHLAGRLAGHDGGKLLPPRQDPHWLRWAGMRKRPGRALGAARPRR